MKPVVRKYIGLCNTLFPGILNRICDFFTVFSAWCFIFVIFLRDKEVRTLYNKVKLIENSLVLKQRMRLNSIFSR